MKRIVFSALAAIISFLTAVVVVFGWFADLSSLGNLEYTGTVFSSYFASGNGTENNPYIINHPRHLYNLAWLQYNGYFNTSSSAKDGSSALNQNYFEITSNLNMSGYVLPPIGTTTYPFMGNLDGGGCTISNLTVSNIKANDEIKSAPTFITDENMTASTSQAEIVGFFGVIGDYNKAISTAGITYNNEVISVSALFLDKIEIRTQTNQSLIGLFAGYVCGNVSNIGVYRS
ncbi:MAG: hypothetical protein ACI4L9_07075, partial [Candidatus Coproplasma sp.]